MWFSGSVVVLSVLASTVPGVLATNPLAVDVCANLNTELTVLHLNKAQSCGSINTCICLSSVATFVSTNIQARIASALVGTSKVISIVTDLINNCRDKHTCHYPDHAVPACTSKNPCFFTCKDGFIASPSGNNPTKCVCPYGQVECNGKCVKGPLCPSGHHKRDISYWGRESQCARGLTACGVLDRSARAWECVDTMNDLESCGGCTAPLLVGPTNALGFDCSALVGVADVSCISGGCIVHRCMPGFSVTDDRSSCIKAGDNHPQILAAQYGLEHVPM